MKVFGVPFYRSELKCFQDALLFTQKWNVLLGGTWGLVSFLLPLSAVQTYWCLLLLISASLLVWPSVSPPPTCLWWIWLFVLRNLWVYFQTCIIKVASVELTLWFAYSRNELFCGCSVGDLTDLLAFSCLCFANCRPSMMTSRKWSRLQLMDPWKVFWDTPRTRYAHPVVLWPGFFSVLFYN